MAPELVKFGKLSKPADVFAFGMVVVEVLSGEIPWKEDQYIFFILKHTVDGESPEIPDCGKGFTPQMRTLVEDCWHGEASSRPAMEEVVRRWQGSDEPETGAAA